MKLAKTMLAVLLSVVLFVSMAATAFASEAPADTQDTPDTSDTSGLQPGDDADSDSTLPDPSDGEAAPPTPPQEEEPPAPSPDEADDAAPPDAPSPDPSAEPEVLPSANDDVAAPQAVVPVTGIKLNMTAKTLTAKGKTTQLKATVAPATASNQNVTWKSSNTRVATVTAAGLVTAKASSGNCTITAIAKDGSGKTAKCEIYIGKLVTSVKMDRTTYTLTAKGKTFQLKKIVAPSDAANKRVTWASTNEGVATVDKAGLVTARASSGRATITATTQDGKKVAKCTVYIGKRVTGIKLNATAKTLSAKGKTTLLKATVAPTTAAFQSVTWKSSNTKVATVSSSGRVTAKANSGSCTITATARDGSGKTAKCALYIGKHVTSVKLDKTFYTLTGKGKTFQLKKIVAPTTAANKRVTWSSSNTKVATVSTTGKVTAKASSGKATITATAQDGAKTAKCTVYIGKRVTGIKLNATAKSIGKGSTYTLKPTFAPTTAANKTLSWKSSNTSVATVSSKGVVTAKAIGTATITVKTQDGAKTATCKVTVKKAVYNTRGNSTGNSIAYGSAAMESGKLFFVQTQSDIEGIYVMTATAGSGAKGKKLKSGSFSELNAIGGYLYYSNGKGYYRMKQDGTGATKLTGDTVAYVNIVGNTIYYKCYSGADDGKLVKMSTTGTGRKVISKDEVGAVNAFSDVIYYMNLSDNCKLYSVKPDGTGRKKVIDKSMYRPCVGDNGYVYYSDYNTGYPCRIKLDGTGQKTLSTDTMSYPNYLNGSVYFTNQWGTYKGSATGTSLSTFAYNGVSSSPAVFGDFIVFANSSTYGTTIYSVKTKTYEDVDMIGVVTGTITSIKDNLTFSYTSFGMPVVTGGNVTARIKANATGSLKISYGLDSSTRSVSFDVVAGKTYDFVLPVRSYLTVGTALTNRNIVVSTGKSSDKVYVLAIMENYGFGTPSLTLVS